MMGLTVVITIALVAANTAAMSIRERAAEIAVMRSIGFSGHLILSLLLAESLIISIAGGLVGCATALGVLKVFAVGGLIPTQTLRVPPVVFLESLVAAALIGLLSAYIPAYSALHRRITEALRLVT